VSLGSRCRQEHSQVTPSGGQAHGDPDSTTVTVERTVAVLVVAITLTAPDVELKVTTIKQTARTEGLIRTCQPSLFPRAHGSLHQCHQSATSHSNGIETWNQWTSNVEQLDRDRAWHPRLAHSGIQACHTYGGQISGSPIARMLDSV
jgi:hypothetical protein